MKNGYIKLYRRLLRWRWFKTKNMTHFWVTCLLKASHAPSEWEGIVLAPGQFISGRSSLSEITGLTVQEVRTCINRLKSTSELTINSYSKFSVFTINDWKSYQSDDEANQHSNQQVTSNQPATNQQVTTNKNVKNIKNEKKVGNKARPKDDQEVFEYMKDKVPSDQAAVETEKFLDHYDAVGWKYGKAGATIKDWKAAARNWVRRSQEFKS